MRRIIQLVAILCAMAVVSVSQATTVGIAATVNGQEIPETKLQKAVDAHLQQQGTNIGAIRDPKKYQKLRDEVLDILIGQKLLWEKARQASLVASDEEVDKLYQQYQAQYPNKEAFQKKMKLEGYDEKSYRKELRQQLSAKKWVYENVMSKVKVEPGDIDTFYTENKEKFKAPEMVKARHILIPLGKDAKSKEKKAAKKLLKKLQKQLAKGADFAELAKKYSKGPTGPAGGDLGYFPRGKMVKPFEDAVFKLKQGEVSDIVKTRFGYHLIKLEQKQTAREIAKEEAAGRIHQHLLRLKSESALHEALANLRKTAKIEKHIF